MKSFLEMKHSNGSEPMATARRREESVVKPTDLQTKRDLHVGIIMDGNGRWAQSRGLPRLEGHRKGAAALPPIVEAAPGLRIRILTVYAFSADNRGRPAHEVAGLAALFYNYLETEVPRCIDNGVRLTVIGRRDRLDDALRERIGGAEQQTVNGRNLHLRIAWDYSSRQAILNAVSRVNGFRAITQEQFGALLAFDPQPITHCYDLDLLIRTGGEKRLSDFMLWESAYAELYFTDVLWPDFRPCHLEDAVHVFAGRERRFGRIAAVGSGVAGLHAPDYWLR